MEKIRCPFCQADESSDLLSVEDYYNGNGGRFTFVRCHQCGLTYLNPKPSSSELLIYNKTMWERWSITEQSKEHIGSPVIALQTYKEVFQQLNKRKPEKGTLLEIGSGQGGFLKVFQEHGWDVYGIDISDECIAYIKNVHEIENAYVVDLLDAGFTDNQFDVVILNHLIEHLENPAKYLREINRILKPDGVLCISTPNIDSLSAHIFGKYWQALFVPLHLVLFSPATLAQMLQQANYSQIEVSHFSHITNSYIFLRSLSCVLRLALLKIMNPLQKNSKAQNPVTTTGKKESRARVLFRHLRPIFNIIISPIIYFESAIKRGSSITVYATPDKSL